MKTEENEKKYRENISHKAPFHKSFKGTIFVDGKDQEPTESNNDKLGEQNADARGGGGYNFGYGRQDRVDGE